MERIGIDDGIHIDGGKKLTLGNVDTSIQGICLASVHLVEDGKIVECLFSGLVDLQNLLAAYFVINHIGNPFHFIRLDGPLQGIVLASVINDNYLKIRVI